eukprot:scaffold9202_cov42-Cyclotella_meneghiniana.AAC.3
MSDRSSNKPLTDSSAKDQSKQPSAKVNKKMKTVLGKPSGNATPSGQPKSPIKKDLLLPDPSSPTNLSSSNKRVQVASPTVETPRPSSSSGLNSNAMSYSPTPPLPKHALSYSKVVQKFSPNSYSSEDTMDRIIAKKTDEPEDDNNTTESTDDHKTAATDEKDDASAWESVEEDNPKYADTVDSSGAPSPAQETKKFTNKSQLSIKNQFQKQHQLNKASKPVSKPNQVKVENYHFDPDDHITTLLEDIHQEIAVLFARPMRLLIASLYIREKVPSK